MTAILIKRINWILQKTESNIRFHWSVTLVQRELPKLGQNKEENHYNLWRKIWIDFKWDFRISEFPMHRWFIPSSMVFGPMAKNRAPNDWRSITSGLRLNSCSSRGSAINLVTIAFYKQSIRFQLNFSNLNLATSH